MFKPLILNKAHTTEVSDRPVRKLFKWREDGDLDLHLDFSSMESFLTCNRLAEYKLVHSRNSVPGVALAFGAAMHAALEVWYKLHDEPDKNKVLTLCREAINNAYLEFPRLNFIDEYRTAEFCYDSFLKYLANYSGESVIPVMNESKPMVEFSFAITIGEIYVSSSIFSHYAPGTLTDSPEKESAFLTTDTQIKTHLKWTGICDLLADIGGSVWLVDHKTTSILDQKYFDGFAVAMQPLGYVYAISQAMPEIPIKGFMLNVLACRKPTKTGKAFEPHRSFYTYEPWQFIEWRDNLRALVEEFIANLEANFFPQKTSWCVGKYGKCAFLDVCTMPPDIRLHILQSDQYSANTWKPVSA